MAARSGLLTPASKLFLLAFFTRVIYLIVVRPPFESTYWALAEGLLSHGSLVIDGVTTTNFEPLYPAFLAISRVFARHNPFVVQLLQVVMASAGAVYTYRLALLLTGRTGLASIGGVLFTLDPLLIRQAALPSDSALVTTLLIAFTYHFVAAATVRQMVLVGAWLGIAVLARSMLAPLLVCGSAILLARRQWQAMFAMMVTTVVLVLPWLFWTHSVNGSWRPTRSGLNLFIGNSVYTATLLPDDDPDILQTQAAAVASSELPHLATLSPPEAELAVDSVLTNYAFAHMAERPLQTLGRKVQNALYLFSPRLVPFRVAGPDTRVVVGTDGQIAIERAEARPLIEVLAHGVSYTPVLAAALVGIYLRRRDLRADVMLWCIVATFTIVHALYFPATRYRAPVSFVLFFYAAVALDRWIACARINENQA